MVSFLRNLDDTIAKVSAQVCSDYSSRIFSSILKDCITKITLPVYLIGGGAGVDGAPGKELQNKSSVFPKFETFTNVKSLLKLQRSHLAWVKLLNRIAK